MSILHVHYACPCCMSKLHGHASCPWCMSMLLVHAACPCCMSMLQAHAVLSCPLLRKLGEIGPLHPDSRLHRGAIGLWKPYAKLESDTNLVLYDVYWLAKMMLFMGWKYLEYIFSDRICTMTMIIGHNRLLNNKQWIIGMVYNTHYGQQQYI
jgi:hypothetical protein